MFQVNCMFYVFMSSSMYVYLYINTVKVRICMFAYICSLCACMHVCVCSNMFIYKYMRKYIHI